MVIRIFAGVLALAVLSMNAALLAQRASNQPAAGRATVQVYKTPTCGCCANWVTHLQQHGFATQVTDMDSLAELKARHGVPARVQSCHTALVDGYVIEGHVPAADVQRLLRERPPVAGIAVPGMPVGSPGMEVPNVRPEPYNVMAFDRQGQLRVFASH